MLPDLATCDFDWWDRKAVLAPEDDHAWGEVREENQIILKVWGKVIMMFFGQETSGKH